MKNESTRSTRSSRLPYGGHMFQTFYLTWRSAMNDHSRSAELQSQVQGFSVTGVILVYIGFENQGYVPPRLCLHCQKSSLVILKSLPQQPPPPPPSNLLLTVFSQLELVSSSFEMEDFFFFHFYKSVKPLCPCMIHQSKGIV